MKKGIIFVLMVMMTGVFFGATAQEILAEVAGNYGDLNDVKATVSLSRKDPTGTTDSDFTFYVLKKDENTRYGIVRFLSPRDKKNITLLTKGPAETYMYMPTLRSVKKMQSSSENEKFADSDFTYGELSLLYKISDIAALASICKQDSLVYVVEIKNDKEELSYSSMKIKIARDKMMPEEVTFFNWEDEVSKVIRITEYREMDGKKVPWAITASDYTSGGETNLTFKEIEVDLGMTEAFFSPKNISRPRLKF